MVGKTYLESMLDESGFGAVTEIGGFALDKGLEVSMALEPFWTSVFTSSSSVVATSKQSLSNTFSLVVPCVSRG